MFGVIIMIKSMEMNFDYSVVNEDICVEESNELSFIDEVSDWLAEGDSKTAIFFGTAICTLSGVFFTAQLFRYLFT